MTRGGMCGTLVRMAPAWREYQEAAAAQFRALGLFADTDQPLDGVRSSHKVDVVVRGNRAGLEFLWIVECKRWKTNVPKSAVATLSAIVQDLGADRGILLSEKGFQPGAVALAQKSNITLTSVAALKEDTYHEWVDYQCAELAKRFKVVRERAHSRTVTTRRHGATVSKTPGRLNSIKVFGRIALLELAIDHGVLKNRWPLMVPIVKTDGTESKTRVRNFAEFLEVAEAELSAIETDVDKWLSALPPLQ